MELHSSREEVKLLKCGVRFAPPAVIVTYAVSGKTRCRIMPLRNFSKNSGVQRVAADLKQNSRHKRYLEGMSAAQLEKLVSMLHDRLNGMSRDEVIAKAHSLEHIDPDEDLNKVVLMYCLIITYSNIFCSILLLSQMLLRILCNILRYRVPHGLYNVYHFYVILLHA